VSRCAASGFQKRGQIVGADFCNYGTPDAMEQNSIRRACRLYDTVLSGNLPNQTDLFVNSELIGQLVRRPEGRRMSP